MDPCEAEELAVLLAQAELLVSQLNLAAAQLDLAECRLQNGEQQASLNPKQSSALKRLRALYDYSRKELLSIRSEIEQAKP